MDCIIIILYFISDYNIMKNPIKIIHKYKNNNRRNQYFIYIYIGSIVPDDLMKILESFQNKSFFDTLVNLTKKNLELLEEYYDSKWYKYFFIKYHLEKEIESIKKNIQKKNQIQNKLGKEWFKNNIDEIGSKKITYSFADNYFDYLVARNKIKTKTKKVEMDFTTYAQTGGFDDVNSEVITDENIDEKLDQEDEENEEITNVEDIDDNVIDDFDLDEISKLYSMENVENDKNIKETSKLISEAINDKSWEKKAEKLGLDFDDSLEEITFDSNIETIFKKIYIKDDYIYKDDTIKTMKNKISTTIPISEKFGKDIKLIPEYLYLWSEYDIFKNNTKKIDRVMVGQKWIRRNELLKIDIKPNDNLSVYENLRNNLSYLRDSFGIKIKREDDENNILEDYDDFNTNNEYFMIDIFNELGMTYNVESEKKKNVFEVFINIYFPFVTYERFDNIIDLLNNKNNNEIQFNNNQFTILNNDTKLENEISNIVEKTNIDDFPKLKDIFNENHIIQSIIHVNIFNERNITGTVSKEVINLYKIFDNFIVSENYPFIQYQTPDAQLTYKFFTNTKKIDNSEILNKWFENAPYGVSFKIKVNTDKYISINLHENNRIEYKITWKEIDQATIDDIKKSYKYVNDLIIKINNENKKIKIMVPSEDKFKYAFINTILKFNLPGNNKINHNDLSDFSRYFFPYVSLVIEPKKRQSQKVLSDAASKYGTYLRYNRISKFKNDLRMHLRILYFLKNFQISDKDLIVEVAKQFNITDKAAAEEIDNVREKYGKTLQKTSKIMKKFKKLPKGKPPGIGIDIQGRDVDNYKIRITGARSKDQLNNIVRFMRTLVYLYYQTYINKQQKYQKILSTLKKLNKIAKRRNKVNEIVTYDEDKSNIKEITSLDKKRLGFKPEEGQNQWTRSCQNSGNDKKRRPIIISSNDLKELSKRGYKFNSKTGYYEKKVDAVIKGKKYNTNVRAVKLANDDGTFNYYTCDPSDNNEHMFIGFLSKSNNPNDLCMPCCFKKDQMFSDNKAKQNYYMKCIGNNKKDNNIEASATKDIGDKIYILQETNKIQEGRFLYLNKELEFLFNGKRNHDKIIKNHYLIESNSGYYFKFTVKDNNYNFLAMISNIFDMSIDDIKDKLIDFINSDKNDIIFSYLNNGDIKTSFKTRENYINYIKNSNYLEYDIVGELIEIPNVLTKKGIYFYSFKKIVKTIKKQLERDTTVENYSILCSNYENKNNINEDRETVCYIKDGDYCFPIYMVRKRKKEDKSIILKKFLDNTEILEDLKEYYYLNCLGEFVKKLNISRELCAKFIIQKLEENNIKVKKQILDGRNKCRYLSLENGILLPITPSGSSYKYSNENFLSLKNYNFKDINYVIKELKKINTILSKSGELNYIPVTIYYNKINKNNYFITSILLKNNTIIPIKNQYMNSNQFKKYGLSYEYQSQEELVDNTILNKENVQDESNKRVRIRLHKNEGYNLFKLELSNYLGMNFETRDRIVKIVKSEVIKNSQKKKELYDIIIKIVEGKIKDKKFIEIIKKPKDLSTYKVSNIRNTCSIHKNKENCNNNMHCNWDGKNCNFTILNVYYIEYVKKVIEELILGGIKFKEIVQEDNYYVSDIVDYQQYSNRPNQKIIKTTNFNIKKIMEELFGKDNVPQLGKRRLKQFQVEEEEEEIPTFEQIGTMLIQEVLPNNNSVVRAYVNSYFWINNNLYDNESRNLGYDSKFQVELSNLFKANIIDYLQNNIENIELSNDLKEYFRDPNSNIFYNAIKKFRKNIYNTDSILELIILSYMFPYPILLYNNYNEIIGIFSNGSVNVNEKTKTKYLENKDKSINIKFYFETNNNIPNKIFSIYYEN